MFGMSEEGGRSSAGIEEEKVYDETDAGLRTGLEGDRREGCGTGDGVVSGMGGSGEEEAEDDEGTVVDVV